MSTIYRFAITIPITVMTEDGLDAARAIAAKQQEVYSSSNDGSEVIANAELALETVWSCNHEKAEKYKYHSLRYPTNGPNYKVECTYMHCPDCRQSYDHKEREL